MKTKKKADLPKTKQDHDDELEALFETFDKQYRDIEEKIQHFEKEVRSDKDDEGQGDSDEEATGNQG